MGFFTVRSSEGLHRSRDTRLKEQMNVLLDRGPDVDDDFWDDARGNAYSEPTSALQRPTTSLKSYATKPTRKALPDAYAVLRHAYRPDWRSTFTEADNPTFSTINPSLVLFVGVNGAGKTTTVGKLAAAYHEQGRKVLLGSADTFRARRHRAA